MMLFGCTRTLRIKYNRETEEELGIPTDGIEVWQQMPKLSSNQKGDYVVEPVVGVIRNFQNLKLKPSRGEVASVFTGTYTSTFI